ncbi:HU family DNA-binding protein [Kitasatospora sp. NPDC088346]|uniref:HU family DNA-binding protein n=1 Tax=Kitasatospora sp. NPDC088346 TaxID=3364073 RepID=UPI0038078EB7
MNKGQLVEAVAGQLGSRAMAEDAVDAVLDTMVRAVVAGDRVQVTGFGTLEMVERAARTARNPQSGELVRVKKTRVPRFRPGQGFKDLVSGTKKLPKAGTAVAKAPKGSLTAAAGAPAAARKATTVAKKTAPAKKTTTTARNSAPAKKTAAPARKTTTAAKKTAPARKATTTSAAGKKAAPTRKATTTAKKTAPAKKTTTTARKAAPAKRASRRTTA